MARCAPGTGSSRASWSPLCARSERYAIPVPVAMAATARVPAVAAATSRCCLRDEPSATRIRRSARVSRAHEPHRHRHQGQARQQGERRGSVPRARQVSLLRASFGGDARGGGQPADGVELLGRDRALGLDEPPGTGRAPSAPGQLARRDEGAGHRAVARLQADRPYGLGTDRLQHQAGLRSVGEEGRRRVVRGPVPVEELGGRDVHQVDDAVEAAAFVDGEDGHGKAFGAGDVEVGDDGHVDRRHGRATELPRDVVRGLRPVGPPRRASAPGSGRHRRWRGSRRPAASPVDPRGFLRRRRTRPRTW